MLPRSQNPDRLDAIWRAQQVLDGKPVYLDTETTGLEAQDQIVEVCIIAHDGQVLVDTLVKPTENIPQEVIFVHGITDEKVKDAPAWPEVWDQVQAALGGRMVVIYNADFDVRMMKQSHAKHNLVWDFPADPFLCLMKLYARFRGDWNSKYGDYRWHSLDAALAQCRIPPLARHRAQEDARLARALLEHIARAAV